MLKHRAISIITYFAICLCIFLLIQKPLFLFYNWAQGTAAMSASDWAAVYYNGFAIDLASAGYLTALPLLLIWASLLLPRFPVLTCLKVYNLVIAICLALITTADAALYEFWEFKLDATVFMYIGDPKNAFASVSAGYVLLRLLTVIGLAALYYWLLMLPRRSWRQTGMPPKWYWSSLAMLALGGLTFCAIRGTRIWPNTPSRVFYSRNAYLNHAALNPMFNLIYTSTKQDKFDKEFNFFTEEDRARDYEGLFPTSGATADTLIHNQRPNVLLIVMEGFGSLFIKSLGGMDSVAPYMSRLVDESIAFTNCYCSSFRTDRGIVSVISGYLGQPTTSIMRYTHKVNTLPGLPKTLKTAGYDTQILYASDITFFGMSEYFFATGHDKLISQDDFPARQRSTKWGVPDHEAAAWLYDDIQQRHKAGGRPWYTTFLTISSHTPFDVPYHRLEDEKLNSFAYTDEAIGQFIDRLRQSPAWANLLVVITADHGFNHRPVASPDFPFIPFLLTGGAANEPRRIDTFCSQTDIAATILGQMGLPHDDFPFSRDITADTYRYPFAFNTFNNGFNLRDSTGYTVYDNVAGKATYGADERREHIGKVILQTLYGDLSAR